MCWVSPEWVTWCPFWLSTEVKVTKRTLIVAPHAVWVCWCFFPSSGLLNSWPHSKQVKRLPTVCSRSCCVWFQRRANFLPQTEQECGFMSGVCCKMSIQIFTTTECLVTLKTFVGPVSSVGQQMSFQMFLSGRMPNHNRDIQMAFLRCAFVYVDEELKATWSFSYTRHIDVVSWHCQSVLVEHCQRCGPVQVGCNREPVADF